MYNRSHKIRMYPNKKQEEQLWKTVGTARFVYNWALEEWDKWYKAYKDGNAEDKPSGFKLCNKWTESRPDWSNEVAFCIQNRAIQNASTAFMNFRKKYSAHPAFKKRNGRRQTASFDNTHAVLYGNFVKLPRIGRVKLAELPRYTGKVMSYTISEYAGEWYVSIHYQLEDDPRPFCIDKDSVAGVDVGLKNPAVVSDGQVLTLPKDRLNKLDKKIKRALKALRRAQRDSGHYKKKLLRKQRLENKKNNIRQDAIHKFTTAVAKNHGTVVVETLDIKEMMDKAVYKSFRRALNESVMRAMLFQLGYKVQNLIKAGMYYPSTKLCSKCGHKKDHIELSDRTYVCESCGAVIDRDLNAATNLMKLGMVSADVKHVE